MKTLRLLRSFARSSKLIFLNTFNHGTGRMHLNVTNLINENNTSPSVICNAKFRKFSTAINDGDNIVTEIDKITYERVCAETLESLCEYFEELVENSSNVTGSDVAYSDGVLTIKLGNTYGTYVINRQTPNKQIWLSSPTSGPKRYDFFGSKVADTGKWIYKHNGESMHELLQREIKNIFPNQIVDFYKLPYGS